MTLFDILRYPISDMPTKEELGRLPTQLRLDWVEWTLKERRKQQKPNGFTPRDINNRIENIVFFLSWTSKEDRNIYVEELRRRIYAIE